MHLFHSLIEFLFEILDTTLFQASLCDLVGLILSANLLGHPVGISTSLPGFVGFWRQLGPSKAIVHGSLFYLAVELLHTKRTY